MGSCFSSKRSKTKATLKAIRVVHLDGSLVDYEDPATVDQVINNFPKHFLCTPIQILQNGLIPLKLNDQLKTGQIYFVLPNSTLRFNSSPTDLTALTRKLTNIAKTGRCLTKLTGSTSPSASPLLDLKSRSPDRYLDGRYDGDGMANMGGATPKSPKWTPILSTIREMSFTRRNESQGDDQFGSFRAFK